MTELRSLVIKHADIIANYHAKYVIGYDDPLLNELIIESGLMNSLTEYDAILVHSCVESLSQGIFIEFSTSSNGLRF